MSYIETIKNMNDEYMGLNDMNICIDDMDMRDKKVYIIPYHINIDCIYPFIQIGLNKIEDELYFIKVDDIQKEKNIVNECLIILKGLLKDYSVNNVNDITQQKINIETYKECFKGYYYDSIYDRYLLFFDISFLNITSALIYKYEKIIFVLGDEILFKKKYLDYDIEYSVIDFFNKNINFLYIKNKITKEYYDLPLICYSGHYWEDIHQEAMFGIKKTNDLYYGNYYQFYELYDAIYNAKYSKTKSKVIRFNKVITYTNDGRYNEGGIIRNAIFIKKMAVMNKNTYGNKWDEEYDSLCLNKYYDILENKNIYFIKNRKQYTSLTYHKINTKLDIYVLDDILY